MPRISSYWNHLPYAVFPNNAQTDGYAILKGWGVEASGRSLPSQRTNYVGWQTVHLPRGWRFSIEDNDFFLVDQHDQIRGRIEGAFEEPKRPSISLDISDEDWFADMTPEEIEEEKRQLREYHETQPRLVLRTSIILGNSFSLGNTRSYWAENALGQHIYGVFDEPVSDDEYDVRVPKLEQKVTDWLDANYPNWQDHNAYWETFAETDQKWPLSDNDYQTAAAYFLADKSEAEQRKLRVKIGRGEQRTDFTTAFTPQLVEIFQEEPPFYIASRIVTTMARMIEYRIGAED